MKPTPEQSPTPARKPQPLGRALRATDAELDALATYSPADIARAVADWQANAPVRARGLVDAGEVAATTEAG